VSLCTPDVHTCGDGVLDPRCEECDDGAANADHVPNACRTTCVAASCGDGTQDAGEACDDGTASPCDGCDAACQPVAGLACGDGMLVPGCADQCDDGNEVAGDGCSAGRSYERICVGGSRTSDCLAEWLVVNPSNVPLVDGHGRFRRTQRCIDGDPACDFDGVSGSCTFRLQVCAGNTDLAGCTPAALSAWDLTKPSAQQAAKRPELAAVRAAFGAVPGVITGVATPDVCSPVVEVVVPRAGTGKGALTLAGSGTSTGGVRDKDALKLLCVP
jgi:cysteine-rich repeat protein